MNDISVKYPRFTKEICKFPKHEYFNDVVLDYGTAGFRCKVEYLDACLYRMGMLAVLRSRCTGFIIGIMVTASHNLADDNGVKLIEPKGEMFKWENYATEIANANNDDLGDIIDRIIINENIDMEKSGNIFIARDTRSSSERLSEQVREGALLLGGNVLDFSLLTTPQLHHLVRMWNNEVYNRGDWASEIGYYNMLVDGYRQLLSTKPSLAASSSNAHTLPLLVDAAHGVGAMQLHKLMTELNSTNSAISIKHEIRNNVMNNDDNDKYLNNHCGADYVQKAKVPPSGFEPAHDKLYPSCSLDGDADRIIYHYFDASSNWHYIDGDKMASLFAHFISEQLSILEKGNEISFGVIQTAYANGASTLYLKSLGIPVLVAKTGVKYCHEKTKEFDISMYFEANGHGAVIYQDKIYEKLAAMESKVTDEKKKTALTTLLSIYQMMNQAVGDAFSNLLLTEAILRLKDWTIVEWDGLYKDLPSRQTKVYIEDKNILKCNEEETEIIEPSEIQETINSYLTEVTKGRAFIRPSGTENAVRIYAEATTQEDADNLALKVAKYIHQSFKGIDEFPQTFVA